MHRALLAVLLAFLVAPGLAAQQPTPAPKPQGTEQPKPEQPKPEQPKPEQPGPEQPKSDQPLPEPPATDQPKPEDPAGEAPTAEQPKPDEGTEVELPEDSPLPQSGDPADLRAMKSAQDMVAAERRMRAAIKSGKIKDVEKLLSFEEISAWPYRDGLEGMPKEVRELDGKEVLMIGFMLPIDEVEDIREFLLVQSLWACCYGTPPDINGIVRVVMKGEKRVDYQFDPIQVSGTFDVKATVEDGYVIDIYQLRASAVSLVK